MYYIEKYQNSFNDYVETLTTPDQPEGLYNPIMYMLGLGGKRLRPVLTLMVTDMYSGNYERALDAAMAVEVFHNFSLIHDDIMDAAPLRRGKQTVHEKWNLNTGILSGDAMLILAYKFFENYQGVMFKSLISLFSKTAIEVCEGQQYDIEFESRTNVAIPEYLKMIEYKTAVLVGASMKMGAIVAKAPIKDQDAIYEFGKYLGIAFQLQDDYLDSFGDSKTFGKQIGGDIVENKKTYLYLKAMELSNSEVKSTLLNLYQEDRIKGDNEVNKVKQIFQETGAALDTKKIIKKYTQKAFHVLNDLNITSEKKIFLRQFGTSLMDREV
ncbi:MAG: polyprenyl synthetase family protein [Flavobacteriaceae bacterium]|nr:polyprenyl synthetase family protein [Flavobacteriaceae bacterium]MDC3269110.1 polyprenyl synthetase family protein [Flavobacteriaceae bacterium]MDG2350282.1 polyprenyl synthetase family protein [Flavobacteriaceae bacterium]